MLNRLRRTLVLAGLALTAATAFAQPANDTCATATAVGDGTFIGSNVGANGDGTASCDVATPAANSSIWFNYTAPVTGTVFIETCGSTLASGGGPMDTVLSVFASCGGAELDCDDDSGCVSTFTSSITLNITSGTHYFIRVASHGSGAGAGTVVLHLSSIASSDTRPENDLCQSPTVIGNGTFTGSNVGAGTDFFSSCANGGSGADVWWRYTAIATGIIDVETCGSSFDTVLSVSNLCGEEAILCNDDAADCGTGGSKLSFGATVGADYFIRIAGATGQAGNITLKIGPPDNGNGNDNNNDNTNANDNTSGNTNTNDNTGANTNDNTSANTNDNTDTNANGNTDTTNGNSDANTNTNGANANGNIDTNGDGTTDGIDTDGDGTIDENLDGTPANPCGTALCGPGAAQLMPLTFLGLCGLRFGRRLRRR